MKKFHTKSFIIYKKELDNCYVNLYKKPLLYLLYQLLKKKIIKNTWLSNSFFLSKLIKIFKFEAISKLFHKIY